MLEYNKIDISEGIDVNKTDLSKECDICHYWCFKDIGFNYEPYDRFIKRMWYLSLLVF